MYDKYAKHRQYANIPPLLLEEKLWRAEQIGKGVTNFDLAFPVGEGNMVLAHTSYSDARTYLHEGRAYCIIKPDGIVAVICT